MGPCDLNNTNSNGVTLVYVHGWQFYAYFNASVYKFQSLKRIRTLARHWVAFFVFRTELQLPILIQDKPHQCCPFLHGWFYDAVVQLFLDLCSFKFSRFGAGPIRSGLERCRVEEKVDPHFGWVYLPYWRDHIFSCFQTMLRDSSSS